MLQHRSKVEDSPLQHNRFQLIHAALLLLFLLLSLSCLTAVAETANPDPLRFQKEIKRFIWQDAKNSYPEQAILFVGSSSIYRWKTAQAFPSLPVINRGFGGSQISDLNYYFKIVVGQYKPAQIICYCGENDVAEGKNTTRILSDFKAFSSRVEEELPGTTLVFLAIKPNPLRWQLWDRMAETNRVIKNYCKDSDRCLFLDTATPLLDGKGQPDKNLFAKDGLHLNRAGYALWNHLLSPYLTMDSKE